MHGRVVTLEVIDARAMLDDATRSRLDAMVAALMPHLDARGEARVRLVDDDEMSRTHARTHADPSTTDVISLNLAEAPGVLDADLVVCADAARRHAGDDPERMAREILLYILHGLLHCLGHDDLDRDSHARMHALEDDLLTRAGIGRVYAPECAP